jgi:hypothetical protein
MLLSIHYHSSELSHTGGCEAEQAQARVMSEGEVAARQGVSCSPEWMSLQLQCPERQDCKCMQCVWHMAQIAHRVVGSTACVYLDYAW